MTDASKKRLGGWTRLWVVCSVPWVLGFSVVAYVTYEVPELSVEETRSFRHGRLMLCLGTFNRIPTPEEQEVAATGERGWVSNFLGMERFPGDCGISNNPTGRIRALPPPGSRLTTIRERANQWMRHYAQLEGGGRDLTMTFAGLPVTSGMRELLDRKRRQTNNVRILIAATALIPPFLFFGLGFAVRWVRHGF
jgi:hypothetical protein